MHTLKLPNGLRAVTVPLHDTKAVTIFVFAKVGSRYETRSTNGISHFIEHLMFKGTKKRPTTLAISKLLDGVGAQYNAFTSKDWTGYYVKINTEHLNLALDIVSDMLLNSKFDEKEIQRERSVIIEEINMYDDNPAMSIEDIFESAVFGDHPIGWNIAGPREVIRTVSRATMLRFRDQHYHAKNMWVVVAGKYGDNISTLIKQYFSKVPSRATLAKYKPFKNGVAGEPVAIKYRDAEQIQVGLGTLAFKNTDPRMPALNLLSIILGGNMSSRLFIQVRERRGLCYSIHSAASPYEDTGSFMIQAGLEKTRLPEALKVMTAELRKLKSAKVTTVELNRAKEFVRGKMILDLEDSDSQASWYGRQALFKKQTIDISTQTIVKILIIGLTLVFLFTVREILVVVFVALVLAAAFDPSITSLERRGIPRSFGIAIIYISVLAFLALIVVGFVPVVIDQFNQFLKSFPDLYQRSFQSFQQVQNSSAGQGLQQTIDSVTGTFGQITKGFFSGVFTFFGGLVSLLSIMVLTFYLTMEEKGMKRLAVDLSPAKYRPYLTQLFNRIEDRLGMWLRGQLMLGLIIGIMTFIGLTILGVKYALVLALIAGVTELFPVVGPIIGAIPAVVVSLSDSGHQAILVAVLYLIIQQLENHLIVPRVMAKATGLNPVIVIISLLVGAKIAGITGVILAVPTIIIITTFLEDFLEEKRIDDTRLAEDEDTLTAPALRSDK